VTTISKRVHNLEKQFGTSGGTQQLLLVVCRAGWGVALDQDRCIEILREAGFLPTGRMGMVDLGGIPDGLNAAELEQYLREHGARPRSV
jgi:hypothetical protein